MQNIKIISISPYNFFQKNNWVNNRIYFINKFIYKNFKNTIFIIRDEDYKDNSNFNWEIFLWWKNKYTHLLNFWVIKKILLYNKKETLLFCNTLWWWIYWLVMKKIFWYKYIFDNHNVEFLRFKRTRSWKYIFIKFIEKNIIKNSNLTTVCSENDKKILINLLKLKNIKIEVIENWVDIDQRKINNQLNIHKEIRSTLNIKSTTKIVLFFWAFDYKPNIEAKEIIEKKIIPNFDFKKYEDVLFLIIWKWLENKRIWNLQYLWFTSNIHDFIIWSNLIIAPLISWSWTKLKIIESLWYWKKVITTYIWSEWIDNDENLIIEDDISIFLEKIYENINNDFIIKKNPIYSWENLEKKFISLINNI